MSPRSVPAEALRPVRFATQQREIAAVHHQPGADDDAVDALAERRVLPFDRGNIERMRIEQDRGDLAAGHTVRHAVEGTKLERHLSALDARELEAKHEWTRTLPGEAPFQAIDGVLACGHGVIARDDEAAASRRAATDEAELMISVRITDQDVMTIIRAHARQDRRELVETDGLRC